MRAVLGSLLFGLPVFIVIRNLFVIDGWRETVAIFAAGFGYALYLMSGGPA